MSENWQQTYTNKVFDYLEPDPSQICLEDIAKHLSQINRFGGATRVPYSVAQHCVLCADQAPLEAKFWALLHDAAEAYLVDVPAPVKHLLHDYGPLEEIALRAICTAFEYDPTDEVRKIVHEIDLRMLMTEKRDLKGPEPRPWEISLEDYPPYEKKVVPWDHAAAEMYYRQAFNRYRP